jgi:hypothetical protein
MQFLAGGADAVSARFAQTFSLALWESDLTVWAFALILLGLSGDIGPCSWKGCRIFRSGT